MAKLIPRNGFAFPAGITPRVNTSHPAARKLIFSGVACGNMIIELTNGCRGGTVFSAGTAGVHPVIGPTTNAGFNYSGKPAIAMPLIWHAMIVSRPGGSATGMNYMSNGSDLGGAKGLLFHANPDSATTWRLQVLTPGVADWAMVFRPLTDYCFIAAFSGGTSANDSWMIYRSFRTGELQSFLFGSYSYVAAASDGVFAIGSQATQLPSPHGVAACAMGTSVISFQEAIAWSEDPWAFWYPDA